MDEGLIINKVIREGEHVFGVYESDSTSLVVHYVNKGANPQADTSRAFLDVEQMFKAMEAMDRRKGRR